MSTLMFDQYETVNQASTDGLITVNLPVSTNGQHWYCVVFEGESTTYLDHQMTLYIKTHQSSLHIGFSDDVNWSLFPKTFKALSQNAYTFEFEKH